MYEIFTSNVITMFLIMGFLVQLATSDVFDKKVERLFLTGVTCIMLLVAVDIADSYFSHQEIFNDMRYISSALGYTIRPVALGVFISILLRKSENIFNLWIPIIILGIVAMTNYWTHVMFYFDENNVFYRGPLGLLPHIVCISYMVLLVYYAIRKFNVTDIGEIVTVFYTVVICLVAMVLETFYGYKYLLTGASICACIIYYNYIYAQVYKIDPVTGLFNRRTFERDTEKKLSKKMIVICADLNDLKVINDTEGHAMGDKALIKVADILVKVAENRYRVYRLGGDEFFVVGVKKSKKDAEKFIKRAKEELSHTRYAASFGFAEYSPNDDFTEVCKKADEEMYLDKKHNKA